MTGTKKKVIVLIISLALIVGITFLAGMLKSVTDILWLKIAMLVFFNLCNGAVALVAMKITGIELELDIKNAKQYLIGIAIGAALLLTIAILPALCGLSLVGGHEDFSWFNVIYDFLNCVLIIGPVEELIFRVYVQDTMTSFFEKKKFIGVIIAAFLFGLWHIINGSLIQVLLTFLIGLVFGFCRFIIKDCKYPGLALGHGLYDFSIRIVRIFIL